MNLVELLEVPENRYMRQGRVYGVVIGLVTNNQDPDTMGRVKVSFPWLSSSDESYWARVAAPMAGNNRGTWFLPEVGDEVLVAFEHGDVRAPYVVGALWNGKDQPPQNNSDGKNNLRVIVSRSGHQLIFNDDSQGPMVQIKTNAGHQFVLDDTSGQENITVKDKTGNNTIVIDSAQNAITITAQMKLSLKAPTIEIDADSMLTVKAGATLTIQGTLVKIN
jgi:uncharacterized protein involved in type VI secretion and phage assembly